jgi:hypothetical protein
LGVRRNPTEQVHRSFFRSLLGVRASTSGVSILGEFGRFPLFVDRVGAISLYYNRLLRLRDSGRLVSLAFEDSVRLAEEVECRAVPPRPCLGSIAVHDIGAQSLRRSSRAA